jgi:hypothetical protein
MARGDSITTEICDDHPAAAAAAAVTVSGSSVSPTGINYSYLTSSPYHSLHQQQQQRYQCQSSGPYGHNNHHSRSRHSELKKDRFLNDWKTPFFHRIRITLLPNTATILTNINGNINNNIAQTGLVSVVSLYDINGHLHHMNDSSSVSTSIMYEHCAGEQRAADVAVLVSLNYQHLLTSLYKVNCFVGTTVI